MLFQITYVGQANIRYIAAVILALSVNEGFKTPDRSRGTSGGGLLIPPLNIFEKLYSQYVI